MKSRTLVDGGSDGTHTLMISGNIMLRGFSMISESSGTPVQASLVIRNGGPTGEIIRVNAATGVASSKTACCVDILEDEGIEAPDGIYTEFIVDNAVAGSIYGNILFSERNP